MSNDLPSIVCSGAPDCERCKGDGWVCENHDDQPQCHDDCGGAGMPCPDCNPMSIVSKDNANG